MSVRDTTAIRHKIKEIIKRSNNAYVYVRECSKVKSVLLSYITFIDEHKISFTDDQQAEVNKLWEQLESLLCVIKGLSFNRWAKAYLQQPIKQPMVDINMKMNFVSITMQHLGVCGESVLNYQISADELVDDFQSLYGIFVDPSNDNPVIKQKLEEVATFMKQINRTSQNSKATNQPSNQTANQNSGNSKDKSKASSSSSSSAPNNDNNNSNENAIEFSSIQTHILAHDDYVMGNKIDENNNNKIFSLHSGKLKNDPNSNLTLMLLSENGFNSERYKNLVSVMSQISHPSIATFVGATTTSPFVIATSTFGDSEALRSCLRSEKAIIHLDGSDKTIIAYKVAEAMAYLHSKSIIHRDLNAANIVIEKGSKNPRIANFGHSRIAPEDELESLTIAVGHDLFRAPELLGGDTYGPLVDVFSFSSLLFELLTGRTPFEGYGELSVNNFIEGKKRPPIPDNFGASEDLKELICGCWAQDPKDRPHFVDILQRMVNKKISFPNKVSNGEVNNSDVNSAVEKFYHAKQVKCTDVVACLELIDQVCTAIGDANIYSRETLRVRAILYTYKMALSRASFAVCDSSAADGHPLDYQTTVDLCNLRTSLEKLLAVVKNLNSEVWCSIALSMKANQFSLDILQLMEAIYVSLFQLGLVVSPNSSTSSSANAESNYVGIEKYELVDSDLTTDYRAVYKIFETAKENDGARRRMREVEDFLRSRHLSLNLSTVEISKTMMKVFAKFTSFEVKREDYKIIGNLGDGMSSIVYRAKDLRTGREVAIKQFKDEYLSDETMMFMLKREITYLAMLKHEYLSCFIGFNADAPLWVISEIVPDGDLYNAVFEHKLSPFQMTKIAFEIAEGMEYLHSKRVIHRDLKTGNVLIDKDTPKITDFGYSKTDISLDMTSCVGTMNYMAPEVIRGELYDTKADVFSYGMMLWEIYAGTYPYSWIKQNEVPDRILEGVNLPFQKPISGDLKELIKKAWSLLAADRPTFSQIIETMIKKKIHFEGAEKEEINAFYEQKAEKRKAFDDEKIRQPTSVLKSVRTLLSFD